MNPRDQYLRTRVMTASPGELLVMLYDGLLQRLRHAQICFEDRNWARAGELLGNAQDILSELMGSLNRDQAPELVDSLFGLYNYAKTRLLDALASRDPAPLSEVHDLLSPLRDAWVEANRTMRSDTPEVVNG